MKKFLKYLYKRGLIVLILVVIINFISLIVVTQSSFFFSDNKFYKYEDFEIGFFGHSEMKDAIDEDILTIGLNKKSKNFSIRGAPLYYTSNLITHFLSKKNLIVIVNLSRNNVDFRGTLKNLFSDPDKSFYYSEFFYYHSLVNGPFFINFLHNIFNLSERINPFPNFKKGEKQEVKINEAIRRFQKDSIFTNEKWKSDKINIDFEINEFDKTIKSHPKTKFIVITTPEHKMNKLKFNNDDRFNIVIKRLCKNKNVEYLDYSDYFSHNKFFRDFNHLSYIGKEEFSKKIFNDLLVLF
jgi:hypothetical protein